MSRLDDIRALLDVAEDALAGIRAEYEASLHAKNVSAKLAVQVKNDLENLRSPLDYVAKHYLEWKDTTPVPLADVAAELGLTPANPSSQQKLVCPHGALRGILDLGTASSTPIAIVVLTWF